MNNLEKYSDEELFTIFNADIEKEIRSRGYEFGWHKQVKYAGEIYILVNPAFPNLVKIGYADDVEKRVKTLNRNSGLPDPYHIYATYKVKKRLEDLKLHNLIDSLDSDLRHAKNREFYEMTPEKAYGILSAIAQINGDEDLLVKNPSGDGFFHDESVVSDSKKDYTKTGRKSRPRFTFSMLNIPVGSELTYTGDRSIKVTVVDDSHVCFNDTTWSLSGLVKKLRNRTDAVQGSLWFEYNGKKLTNIRDELEKAQQG